MPQASTQDITFNGVPAVSLTTPAGAEAIILLHGAHLVSWKPAGGEERIYLSEQAVYDNGAAIRGGVPICFPQFGKTGPLPQHGFVRNMQWSKVLARGGDDFAMAVFRITDTPETRAIWPHPFAAEFSISITGARLDMEFEVENTGDASLSFTAALHTYMRVKEAEEVQLEGLRGQQYRDLLTGTEHTETGTFVSIDRETTRLYRETANPLLLREDRQALGINTENMPDTVVWNPWEQTCAAIGDLPDNAFRRFLCVEAGAITKPVELEASQSWWGRQSLVAM
ncbi:D-hexose-6-phosphate mutarotase [Uliginosibacterium paludis]|uniref:Putative glucose-6-phosphate 1-epimerase n=1 Tax=Uliginosibacterium paludis TaxID=1615952 RepID=A0ABV2CU17_9RHOO